MKKILLSLIALVCFILTINVYSISDNIEYEKTVNIFNKDFYIIYDKVYEIYVPDDYQEYVSYLSKKHLVPIWIIARVIEIESNWNSKAINKNKDGSYDYGIMQLNSKYIRGYFDWKFNDNKKINYYDPYINMEIGVKYLKHLYDYHKSWREAVAAYNCGSSKVLRNEIPLSTKRYVEKVFQYKLVKSKGETNVWQIKF